MRIYDKNKLKYKPGDVVFLKQPEYYSLSNYKDFYVLNTPLLIIRIIEKEIVNRTFDGLEIVNYYIYEVLCGSKKMEISDNDIR